MSINDRNFNHLAPIQPTAVNQPGRRKPPGRRIKAFVAASVCLSLAVPVWAVQEPQSVDRITAAPLQQLAEVMTDAATDAVPHEPGVRGADGALVPADASHGLSTTVLSGRQTVGIALPAKGAGTVLGAGTVAYEGSAPDTQVVVDKVNPGIAGIGASLRSQITFDRASAPTRYTFDLKLPAGAVLERQASGAVYAVNRAGKVLDLFGKPWAMDAEGRTVPTRYEVAGDRLVQVVEHRGASYPVVADPWWFVALVVAGRAVTHKLAVRAATQAAARQAAIAAARRQGYRTIRKTYAPIQGNFFQSRGFRITWGGQFERRHGYPSFDAFKRAQGTRRDYEWHHIVEQNATNLRRFGPYNIHNKQNLINIRRALHRACINSFMSTKLRSFTAAELRAIGIRRTPATANLTLRQALNGYSLRNMHLFGLRLLSMCGVKIS